MLAALCNPGCGAQGQAVPATSHAMSEKVLAARKLQQPLSQHLCKATLYATQGQDWRVARVTTVSGRGGSAKEALEALCREADGLKVPAVVDIHYWRAPGGWSSTHELHGTAIRFDEGFTPPPPPDFSSLVVPQERPAKEEPAPSAP